MSLIRNITSQNERNTILLVLIFITLFLGISLGFFYIKNQLNPFSDGIIHECAASNIIATGQASMDNPLNLSLFSTDKMYYLPIYHIELSAISLITNSKIDSSFLIFSCASILLIFLSVIILFNRKSHLFLSLSLLFLSFVPMIIWVFAHRVMEIYTYPLAFLSIALIIRCYFTFNYKILILSIFLAFFLVVIKVSTFPLLLFVLLMSIFLNFRRKSIKKWVLVLLLILIVLLPAIIFFTENSQNLVNDYPLLQKITFANPISSDIENNLSIVSQFNKYQEIAQSNVRVSRAMYEPFITDILSESRYAEVLQFFSPFAITSNANYHWFGFRFKFKSIYSFFTILFLYGLSSLIVRAKKRWIHLGLLLAVCVTPFYFIAGELRYNFYINLFFIGMYSYSLYIIITSINNKKLKTFFIFLTVIFLALTWTTAFQDVFSYKNSIHHWDLPSGGEKEIQGISSEILNQNITILLGNIENLCPYNSIHQKWDWRIFLISDNSKFYDSINYFNFSYALIPKMYLNHNSSVINWKEDFIPVESSFYKLWQKGGLINIYESDNLILYKINATQSFCLEKK